jgi:hypothetical protein
MPETKTGVQSTVRALFQWVNPVLANRSEIFRKARGQHAVLDGGDWYVLDLQRSVVGRKYVDPKEVEATLGLMKPFEVVRD